MPSTKGLEHVHDVCDFEIQNLLKVYCGFLYVLQGLPLELAVLIPSGRFPHFRVSPQKYLVCAANRHRPLIPYYCRNFPTPHSTYNGYPNFLLRKRYQLFISQTLRVLWPRIPNVSLLLSVTKRCKHVALLCDFVIRLRLTLVHNVGGNKISLIWIY